MNGYKGVLKKEAHIFVSDFEEATLIEAKPIVINIQNTYDPSKCTKRYIEEGKLKMEKEKKTNTIVVSMNAEITMIVDDGITLSDVNKIKDKMEAAVKSQLKVDDFHAKDLKIQLFDI